MEQEKLLKKIAGILHKLDIPYIITGGVAVVIWGRPRFTADIDIVIELMPGKIRQLAEELLQVDKDVYVDRASIQNAIQRQGEFNFIHSSSGLKVDFWVLKNDQFDKERMKRRIKEVIAGIPVFITTPEDLILIKLMWYQKTESTRQLEDIESIITIQKKLDWRYLQKWANIQSTATILESVKKKIKKHETF